MSLTLTKLLEEMQLSHSYVERVIEFLKEKESEQSKIYIFGAGDRAVRASQYLSQRGIHAEGFLVNRKYFKAEDCEDRVFCYEDKVKVEENLILVLGCSSSLLEMKMFDSAAVQKVIPISLGVVDDYFLSWETCKVHTEELDWLYERLEDEQSKQYLLAHLQGRLTGEDIPARPSGWSDPQYFLPELMSWSEEECVMDGGAFIGDSVEEFLHKKPSCVSKYKIFAWEPDPENFKKLKETYQGNPNVVPIEKGMFSSEGSLYLKTDQNGNKESGRVSEKGDVLISVSTIDIVAEENRVTFIKMDVEGSELEALKGAQRQITKNRPRLAICLYHKQEDLWTIPQYVNQLCPDYKFYLRPHSSMPTELVLFCMIE